MTEKDILIQNVSEVRRRIHAACLRCGRTVDDVTLVAVTKTVDINTVEDLSTLPTDIACSIFGENRVQELSRKMSACPNLEFHLIGSLQTNKVNQVVGAVSLIHSVDSLRLLKKINECARRTNVVQKVLLQVNVSGEESKHGLSLDQVADVIEHSLSMTHVDIRGLMTMAVLGNCEDARPIFALLRKLSDELRYKYGSIVQLEHLSMGMSNDFEVAIEEGATFIRVGSQLFRNME